MCTSEGAAADRSADGLHDTRGASRRTEEFSGKVVVVTGAGAGIGRGIALEFGDRGATVAIADLDGERARSVARELKKRGVAVEPFVTDVSSEDSVRDLAEGVTARLGPADIVINNAGIFDGGAILEETDPALWGRVIDVNLRGPYLVSRAFLHQLTRDGRGVIVNIASIAGKVGSGGGLAYTASKHGVIGITKQLALSYASRGLRVNAVCPGSIETEITRTLWAAEPGRRERAAASAPAARIGQDWEIARAVAFLAGEGAEFIHGAALVVDGGWTTR